MRQHLKERIGVTQDQIAALEKEQAQAQKTLITVQGQRSRLAELQHDVVFRSDQLNAREKAAEEAKLKSKLTFSDMTVLDKATPPLEPSFPKPLTVIPLGIGAGLVLGLLLALLARRPIAGSALRSISNIRRRARSWAALRPCGVRRRASARRRVAPFRLERTIADRLDIRPETIWETILG